jgi:hypothetical protein
MPPESKKTYSKSTLIETVLYRRPKRKRKLMWMARFGAEIAKHNALMISRSQNIMIPASDCE